MLGTLSWMVMVVGSGLLPLNAALHVCDSLKPGTQVCDPATNGSTFFECREAGLPPWVLYCPLGLLFNNEKGYCDWPSNTKCTANDATTTTTTSTPISTGTPKPTRTTNPTSTARMTTTTTTKRRLVGNPCLTAAPGARLCDPATNGTTFIVCDVYDNTIYRVQSCPGGTFFNQKTQNCDWQENIEDKCVAGDGPPQQPPTPTSVPGTGSTTSTNSTTTTARMSTTTAPFPSGQCDPATCTLPDCRCMGTDIPGNLAPSDVPQMVLLTFDDYIHSGNFDYYEQLFPEAEAQTLKNSSKCRASATFFVSGVSETEMGKVKTLWERGNEIASHSKTHSSPSWWSPQKWIEEMQGMRTELATALGVPPSQVRGMRTPFLQLGGDTQFSMMQYHNFTYDSSMFGGILDKTKAYLSHPLWPFSFHYPPPASQLMCDQGNCPARSYPGVWEIPIIRQYALDDSPCSMTDSCNLGADATADDVKRFLRQNFDHHYSTNRAPFMISLHATWFSRVRGSFQGLKEFLGEINADPNVWQVTLTQMLDWVRHPVSRDQLGTLPSWKACV